MPDAKTTLLLALGVAATSFAVIRARSSLAGAQEGRVRSSLHEARLDVATWLDIAKALVARVVNDTAVTLPRAAAHERPASAPAGVT